MVYIDSIKGTTIAFVIFAIVSVSIPGFGELKDVEIILTVSTFLFAIIAGFYMSRMNSKYDRIREFVAQEDALWLSLFQQAKLLGRNFSNRIRELIDKYYIIAYDFSEYNDYYKHNAKYYLSVYDEMEKLNTKQKSETPFDKMLETMKDIENVRNSTSVFNLENLTRSQWVVLVALSGVVVFSIFYIQTAIIFSKVTTILLSTILVLVILTIRDLQNQRLGGAWLLVESGQEVLDFIGKLRYYPERFVKDGRIKVPKYVKKYRIGIHKPGDHNFKFKIVSK